MVARLQLSTDRQIAALKPADQVYEMSVGDSRGLGVRVFPTGLKQFEFRYVATNGTRRRLCLGAYPDLSLAKARSKVAALRIAVVDGGDPVAEMTAARERARTGETLDELAEAYWQAGPSETSPSTTNARPGATIFSRGWGHDRSRRSAARTSRYSCGPW